MKKNLLKLISAAASLSMLSVCSLPTVEAYAVNDYGVSVLSADYSKRNLTANQLYFYNALGNKIDDIAAGRSDNTVITIPGTGLTGGLSALASDINTAYKYLLADKPQSIYWIDKQASVSINGSGTAGAYSFTVTIPVASEYAAGANKTDPAKIAAANTALQYARSIAAKYADRSAYEKAVAYKNEICDLVSYNRAAANNPAAAESSAWQLIYVFDKDASTNVVCEGYSKAFQYLCDLGGVECCMVTGTMSSGGSSEGHMWNIVKLGGAYYLVDVTNCDDSSIGAPDLLFLKGAKTSTSAGCTFVCHNQPVVYTYDSETTAMYSPAILTVSTADCDPTVSDEGGSDVSDPGEGGSDVSNPGEGGSDVSNPGEGGSDVSNPGEGGSDVSNPGEGGSDVSNPGEGGSDVSNPGEGGSDVSNPGESGSDGETGNSEKVAAAKTDIEGLGSIYSFNGVPANKFDEQGGKDRVVNIVNAQIGSTGASASYVSHTVDTNNKTVTFTFNISAGDIHDTARVSFKLGEPENNAPAPAPAPVVYGVSFTGGYSGSGVTVNGAYTAGSQMTVTAPVGYEAVVTSGGSVIARAADGTAAFTMPAGNITVSVSSYLGAVTAGYKNAYIYSYDSDMNHIATNSVRGGMQSPEGEITVKLGKKYAGRTVTLYSGRKSTSAKIDEAVLDSRGQAVFTAQSGKNYTLVVE